MVLRPSDLPADETPEMEMDFDVSVSPQAIPFEMTQGNRRSFLAALVGGAAVLAAGDSVLAQEPLGEKEKNVSVKGNASNTLSAEDRVLREWRRKHIIKSAADYKKELDPIFDQARLSQKVEQLWCASQLAPSKYVQLHPSNFDKASDWGEEGKTARGSGTKMIIFRVVKLEKDIDPKTGKNRVSIPEGAEKWFLIGFNSNSAKVNPNNNPDGICNSHVLFSDAKESIEFIESGMKRGGVELVKVANK